MQSIKRADKKLYDTSEPLKLLTGETLVRYLNSVGKFNGPWVTVQKNYSSDVIPFKEFMKAQSALDKEFPLFQYECVSYNLNSKEIRFEDCPYFDEEAEPEIKGSVTYNSKADSIQYVNSTIIIKHKWLLVKDDYIGFNVEDSYSKSKYEEET